MSHTNYFAHPSTYIDDDCKIGEGTKIWHFCHLMHGCIIGNNCNLGQNVVIGGQVKLGNNVKVQNNVSIYDGVTCHDDVFIGPSVVFTNVINPRSAVIRKHAYLPTLIKTGASIGANATIVCGNTLGKYCFVGAGAVVTKSIEDYAMYVGNPAKHIGWVSEYGNKLIFDKNNTATCVESGQQYSLNNNVVVKLEANSKATLP